MAEEKERELSSQAPQISAAIDKIMANPELISMVASALSASAPSAAQESSAEAEEEGGEEKSEASEPISASSAVAEKLPDLAASLAPLLSSLQHGTGAKSSPHSDRRACLLAALKPYLSRERCEAIDYMIKLGKLSELFRGLG